MVGVKFFDCYEDIEAWVRSHPEGVVVADQTPLLANLSMQENIALMDEVHRLMPIQSSQKLARNLLAKLDMSHIENKRVGGCSDFELFAAMLSRAERMPKDAIFIVLPSSLLGHADAVDQTIALITLLDSDKTISILELNSNRMHYQGRACHILD